jgi:hypothetical protein
MNLNGKVKRIESRVMENGLQFCGCFNDFVNQMIDGVYNGVPYETDASGLPKGFCEKCQKPCDVEMIENFNRQLEMILPAFAVEEVSESAVIEGVLPLEVARLLQMPLSDINRHIRSGRLSLDASGKFVTQDSLAELQKLIRSKS